MTAELLEATEEEAPPKPLTLPDGAEFPRSTVTQTIDGRWRAVLWLRPDEYERTPLGSVTWFNQQNALGWAIGRTRWARKETHS